MEVQISKLIYINFGWDKYCGKISNKDKELDKKNITRLMDVSSIQQIDNNTHQLGIYY